MRRVALVTALSALAAAALLTAGGAAAPQLEPGVAPARNEGGNPILTQHDHGRTLALRTGRTATLRVSGDGALKVSGAAVTLSEVFYFADPGFREWELRASRLGTTVITAPRSTGGSFTVTIRVTAQ